MKVGAISWLRGFLACGFIVTAGCASEAPSGVAVSDGRLTAVIAAPTRPAAPGLHRLHAGADATLYIPARASEAPAPFLILLHGAGGDADGMIRRFRAEADRRGIILFAPESRDHTWDAIVAIGRGRPPVFGDDVARIDRALADAFTRAHVDPARVGIAGFSDGAGYALSLGVRNSERFSAILAFSAGMIVPGDTGPPTDVFLSHGERDRILPIDVARDTLAPLLRQARFNVTFVSFDGGHELPDAILARALDGWLS